VDDADDDEPLVPLPIDVPMGVADRAGTANDITIGCAVVVGANKNAGGGATTDTPPTTGTVVGAAVDDVVEEEVEDVDVDDPGPGDGERDTTGE
jgi:hypothetical protein